MIMASSENNPFVRVRVCVGWGVEARDSQEIQRLSAVQIRRLEPGLRSARWEGKGKVRLNSPTDIIIKIEISILKSQVLGRTNWTRGTRLAAGPILT